MSFDLRALDDSSSLETSVEPRLQGLPRSKLALEVLGRKRRGEESSDPAHPGEVRAVRRESSEDGTEDGDG